MELMFGYPTLLPFLNYPTTTITQHSYLPYAVAVAGVVIVIVIVNCSDSIRDLVMCWVVDVG